MNLALGVKSLIVVPPRILGREVLLAGQDTAYAVCTSRWFEQGSASQTKSAFERRRIFLVETLKMTTIVVEMMQKTVFLSVSVMDILSLKNG